MIKNIAVFLFPRTSDECSRTKATVKKKDIDPAILKIDREVKYDNISLIEDNRNKTKNNLI
jgi:hypothetical protein